MENILDWVIYCQLCLARMFTLPRAKSDPGESNVVLAPLKGCVLLLLTLRSKMSSSLLLYPFLPMNCLNNVLTLELFILTDVGFGKIEFG